MNRVVVEVWANGEKRKTYLEYFQYAEGRTIAKRRKWMNEQAVVNVRAKFGRFHPENAEFKVTLGS